MDVEFADGDLRQLFTDPECNAGFSTEVIRAFRKKVLLLMTASDERDLRNAQSLHYKQLKGNRKHQWSLRLNGPWRLILEKRTVNCVAPVETGICLRES
jgi:proteic killer suppression protein